MSFWFFSSPSRNNTTSLNSAAGPSSALSSSTEVSRNEQGIKREEASRSAHHSSARRKASEDRIFRLSTDLLGTATPALCSGAIQAIIFNPFDRALFVRVQQKRRRFLDKRNFQNPFQGFANAAVYRTISSASYIFWQDSCRHFIDEIGGGPGINRFTHENYPILYSAVTGIAAGAANGLALNNMQAVKFTMWSQSSQVLNHWETTSSNPNEPSRKSNGCLANTQTKNAKVMAVSINGLSAANASNTSMAQQKGFFRTAKEMYHVGGVNIFFRGVKVTMLRDTVFGLVYEVMRKSSSIRSGLQNIAHLSHVAKLIVAGEYDKSFSIDGGPMMSSSRRLTLREHRQRWKAEHHKELSSRGDQNRLAFVQNVLAACCGCAASSPINFLRSLAYGTPYGALAVPISTLFRFHMKEVAYVFRRGHTFLDVVKGTPQDSLYFSEIRRIENARARLGFRPLYTYGEGKEIMEMAAVREQSSLLKRFLKKWDENVHASLSTSSSSSASRESSRYYPRNKRHFLAAAIHVNRRLNIGWGSLRVGLGMAVGQHVFAMVRQAMDIT